ncbi:MAG: glycosyltransferase family 25 protein [Candidatus Saccharibacteria bacterium]
MEYLENIHLINLAYRTDRLKTAVDEFNRHNITSFQRFPAVRYSAENFGFVSEFAKYCSIPKIRSTYEYLTGSFGCLLSHYKIIQKAKEDGKPFVTIFEDDFQLVGGFVDKFLKCLDDLPKDWQMFHFAVNHQTQAIHMSEKICKPVCGYSTVGYIVKNDLFDKILSELLDYGKEIDVYYAQVLHPLGTVYCPIEPLMSQRPSHSDILGHFVKY